MKIYFIEFLVLLYSCGKHDATKIDFDGHTFELPIKVRMAKEKLNLKYGYYVGFFGGDLNDPTIETQLEGYPLFMGSDNDNEEGYNERDFVGITFLKDNKPLEQLRNEFENQYNKKFKRETINFGVTKTTPLSI